MRLEVHLVFDVLVGKIFGFDKYSIYRHVGSTDPRNSQQVPKLNLHVPKRQLQTHDNETPIR